MLALPSVGERCLAILARRVDNGFVEHGSACNAVRDNATWSQAIVRAALAVPAQHSLHGLDFIALGKLSDYPVRRNLQGILRSLWTDTHVDGNLEADLMAGESERWRVVWGWRLRILWSVLRG